MNWKTGTTISTGYARSGKLEEKGRSRKKPQTSRTGRAKMQAHNELQQTESKLNNLNKEKSDKLNNLKQEWNKLLQI